jgi:hypothetical protein
VIVLKAAVIILTAPLLLFAVVPFKLGSYIGAVWAEFFAWIEKKMKGDTL